MIINKTKERILAHSVRVCHSIFPKAAGLMFTRRINDFGLVFSFDSEKKRSLHMFFVFYPIDVLFLNEKWEIVEIKKSFKPFTFYFPEHKAKYIIELPAGIADETNCGIGDIINFK